MKLKIIEKEMKQLGMYQKDLAEKVGVSLTTVKAWKDGTFKPSVRSYARMKELGFSDQACFDPSLVVEI